MKKIRYCLLIGLILCLAGCGATLNTAVVKDDREKVIELLDKGADINEVDRSNFTPLHWAAYYGLDGMTKLLLDRGAKPDVQAGQYGTPLILSVQFGFIEVARLLVEHGADPSIRTPDGKTAFDFANDEKNPYRAGKETEFVDILKLLQPGYTPSHPVEVAKGKPLTDAAKPGVKDTTPPRITITSPQAKRGIKITAKDASYLVRGYVEDESGVAWVTVNEQRAALDDRGNFQADVMLRVGENDILVEAMDIRKNYTSQRASIIREAEKSRTASRATGGPVIREGGRNHALIIGVNRYKNFDRLQTAVNDATGISNILKKDYGFETTLILDERATRQNIMREINRFKLDLNPEDRFLIYYAGHGYLDKVTDTSYWLPVDAERNDPTNWIESKSISDQLKRTRAAQVLVVADSCYAGTISRSVDPVLAGRGSRESYLQKLRSKPSRVLIASGGNEPVDDSGGRGHSVFADVLIRSLSNPIDEQFTAEELLIRQIKESVAGRAEQTPEYRVIRNSGHDGGDFVFIRRR